MITPLDIENKKFAKQMMNGYNVDEVDDFLDELTLDYGKLYKESTKIGMGYTYNNSIFSLSRFTPGEYLNLMKTDIDIVCSFITNGIFYMFF